MNDQLQMMSMFGLGPATNAAAENPEAYAAIQGDRTRQLIAQMLLARGMQQPQGQMVGRFYVPASPLQHIGNLAQAGVGVAGMNMADQKRMEMAKQIQDRQKGEIEQFQQAIAPKQVDAPMAQMGDRFPVSKSDMPDTWDINELQGGPTVGMQTYPNEPRAHMSVARPIRERYGMEETTQTMPTSVPRGTEEIKQAMYKAMSENNPRLRHLAEFMAQQQQMAEQKEQDRQNRLENTRLGFSRDLLMASAMGVKGQELENLKSQHAKELEAVRQGGQNQRDNVQGAVVADPKSPTGYSHADLRTGKIVLQGAPPPPPGAGEKPLSAKDQQKLKADHAEAWQAVQDAEMKAEMALKKIDWITSDKNKDAFNSNYGGYNAYATQLLPGETQDVKNQIDSLKQNLKEGGFALVRANGGIGSMTEREWPIVEEMINSIGNPRIGEDEARRIYQDVKDFFSKKLESARSSYDMGWSDTPYYQRGKQGAPAAPAAPSSAPNGVRKYNPATGKIE